MTASNLLTSFSMISSSSGRAERLALYGGVLLTLIGVAVAIQTIARNAAWPHQTDMDLYLEAAKAIWNGHNPYPKLISEDPYAYPPLLAALFAPLTIALGDGKMWALWPIACAASLGFAIAFMLRRFGPKIGYSWIVLIFGFLMTSRMIRSDLNHGQVNMALLLLIVVGLRQFLSGRVVVGALAWAITISVKPFLAVLIFYLIRRRNWAAAATTIGIATLLLAASFALFSYNAIDVFKGWLAITHYYTSFPRVADLDNQSFYGFFTRILAENPYSQPWVNHPQIIPVLMIPIVGAAIAIYLYGVPGQQTFKPIGMSDGPRALLEVGMLLALSLGCGPLMEGDHALFTFPGLFGAAMLATLHRQETNKFTAAWIAAVAAWCFALGAFACPVTVKFFVPAYLTHKVSGLTLLVTGRLCTALFLASVFSAFALRRDFIDRASQCDPVFYPGATGAADSPAARCSRRNSSR